MIVRLKSVSTIDIQIFCLVKLKANVDKQTKVLINTESKSDYINASYINVFFTFISQGIKKEWKNAFIATQAPLTATRDSFWEMIYQQNSSTIIMLCKNTYDVIYHYIQDHSAVIEYWPEEVGASTEVSEYTLSYVDNEAIGDYLLRRKFLLTSKVILKVN